MHTNKIGVSVVTGLLLMPLFIGLMFAGGSVALDPPALNETDWKKGTIDAATELSGVVSVAIDDDGYLHVSYYDSSNKNLMYASNEGGAWNKYVVDDSVNVGKYNSIAVDSTGTVHISYNDEVDYNLKYAKGSASTWSISTLASEGSVGEFNSIVVDGNDDVHITYMDDSGNRLMYATDESGSWVMSAIAEDISGGNSLGINDKGMLFSAYVKEDNSLNVAVCENGDWEEEYVTTGSGLSLDTAYDQQGKVYVAFVDTSTGNLKVATRTAQGSWGVSTISSDAIVLTGSLYGLSITFSGGDLHSTFFSSQKLHYALGVPATEMDILDTTGGRFSAAVADQEGNLHIVYGGGEVANNLRYMTNKGAIWSSQPVDTGIDAGKESSLALDDEGNVHIAYYDAGTGSLKYANDIGGWNNATVDNSTSQVGRSPSLAVDADGYVHISYFDNTGNKILKYATNRGGDWVVSPIDSIGNVGSYNAIGVDANGSVFIAYYNSQTMNMRFASIVGGDLTISSLDSSNSADGPISLAVDSTGKTHVAYYKAGQLAYANNIGGSWAIQMLDTSGDLGGGVSLAIDASDNCHISYYDDFEADLKYISSDGGTFGPITSVDKPGDVGSSSSIAVDAQGEVHIAYLSTECSGTIKYAEVRDGIWLYQKLPACEIGPSISLGLDAMGRGHISYFDSDSKGLMYTTSLSAPSPVQNLTAEVSTGVIELHWNAPANDGGSEVQYYVVYNGSSANDLGYLATVSSAGDLMYRHVGLTNGVPMYYLVEAWTDIGSSRSPVITATASDFPDAPEVKASGKDKAVELKWDAPFNGGSAILSYNIYKKNATGVFQLLTTVSGDVTKYTDTGLVNGEEYSYSVTAVNSAGESVPSDTVTAEASPGSDMLLIAVVIIAIAAAAVGVVFFLRSKGKL